MAARLSEPAVSGACPAGSDGGCGGRIRDARSALETLIEGPWPDAARWLGTRPECGAPGRETAPGRAMLE